MWADRLTFLEQRRAHDQMAFVRLGTSTAGLFAAVDATAWSFLRWHQPTSTPVMTLAGCVTATITLRTSKKGRKLMARYTVIATVSVDVEMSIEAESAEAAKAAFNDHVIMTAGLVDVPEGSFDVNEDSISDIHIHRARADAA